MLRVPPAVRAKAKLAGAVDWLDGLPALIASLESDWADLRPIGEEMLTAANRIAESS